MMNKYVLGFQEIDRSMFLAVGGKGANLGELTWIQGICVPDGFCITTEAYKKVIEGSQELSSFLDELSCLKTEERENINSLSAKIRRVVEEIPIRSDIAEEITGCLTKFGNKDAFAVRSSATAEDLPTTSFAGQHDTYLNIIGTAVLKHIRKCWASLFTERAIVYRIQNCVDHRKVRMSVVVQKMVFPEVAGIMFTADPVTSNRKVVSIDASFGLGEAMVSGLVNADSYKVRNGKIIGKKISTKKLAIFPIEDGGTKEQEIKPEMQNLQALTDEEIRELEKLGRKVEQHFGSPQDIEWCLVDRTFFFVQSRPITTLFPIPESKDQENHVYISVSHQQMMTDAMKPLGLSLWQLTARRLMFSAGGRLFVDVTHQLASPANRRTIIDIMGEHDPLIKYALMEIIEWGDFIKTEPDGKTPLSPIKASKGKSASDILAQIENDPAIVSNLINRSQTSIQALKENIKTKSGQALFDFILEDLGQLKDLLSDPKSMGVFMSAIDATSWINEHMLEWLGEKNTADIISQSVPNNITSEMGLELLDLADVIRPYPEVIKYLHNAKDDTFWDGLIQVQGGNEARDAITAYLDKYGMRCAGEIDITKARWSERPTTLLPLILSNVENFESDASKRKFERGRKEASTIAQELLYRLKQLPEGEQKANETKGMISLLRNFIGYREYPKYEIVSRYFIYKQALLKETEQLVQANVLHAREDAYYLNFEELRDVVRTGTLDYQLIKDRKEEFRSYEKLTPPRVITSDGEIVMGKYERDNIPGKAFAGLAVSSGVIEGRARVILSMTDADLEDGDILVTTYTDPSWTPLFLSIKGLVTEVGGLMTHGAVIAREYGLPAVVGVENATRLIKNGDRIRVNGTEGYIEILQSEVGI
jgi:pyruvate,water dikinase